MSKSRTLVDLLAVGAIISKLVKIKEINNDTHSLSL